MTQLQPQPPANDAQLNATRRGSARNLSGRIQGWARSHGTMAVGGVAVLGVGAFALYRAHENAASATDTSSTDTSSPAAAGVTDSGTGYSDIPDGVDPATLNATLSALQGEIAALSKPPAVTTAKAPVTSAPKPAAPKPAPAPAAKKSYSVVRGDTLTKIAAKFHLSLSALEKLNPQIKNPNYIVPGEKVYY